MDLQAISQPDMQVRIRHDLVFVKRQGRVQTQWIVKDPVCFNHFLFSNEEYVLLNLFNGVNTLDDIRHLWQTKFHTRSLTRSQLRNMAQRFLADNLLVAEQFGAGNYLRNQRKRASWRQFLANLTSPYVIRIGRINPRIVLESLSLPARILFTPFVIATLLFLASVLSLLFIGHFENAASKANLMPEFYTWNNLLVMALVVIATKCLHELGHALACRKFGGECFEIGILLIAFFPTLYCDVSDSWTFQEKWKRILVSFAGIYVEIILALAAATLWLTTSPGFSNTLFFNVAIVCSINTLLINGNPLLKFDGYYILSDLFDQPNLSSESRLQSVRLLNRFFGERQDTAPINGWLCLYFLLSTIYRWLIIVSIIIGLAFVLKWAGFGRLGDAFVFGIVALMSLRMLGNRKQLRHRMGVTINTNYKQKMTSLAIGVVIVAVVFLIRFPSYRYCEFVVEPAESVVVYSPADGQLNLNVNPYELVMPGTLLGEVDDQDLKEKGRAAKAKLDILKARRQTLAKLLNHDGQVAIEIENLDNEILKSQSSTDALGKQISSLSLVTEIEGVVSPVNFRAQHYDGTDNIHVGLQPSLFDIEKSNYRVRRGQPILTIDSVEKYLVAYANDDEIEIIEEDQTVVVQFQRKPGSNFEGAIKQIVETETVSRSNGSPSLNQDSLNLNGAEQLQKEEYRIVVSLNNPPDNISVGSNGRMRILVARKTLFEISRFAIQRWWGELQN